MNKYLIKDIALVVNGSTPSTKREDFYNGDIVWITPKDLSNLNSKYISKGEKSITELGYRSCSTTLIPKGSILLSSRAPIGLLAIAKNELCTNQGFKNLVLNNDLVINEFLYYWLKTKIEYISSLGTGTTFKEVSKHVIENIEIDLPSYSTQKQIAKVLSDLDAKIEVNNKINKELEAMAKTLYDYWFVQFDFPDENGKPYKSSGGKMVYNEELKREIPEGWKDGTIGDIGDLTRGVTYSKKDIKTSIDKGVTPILRATNISGNVVDLDNMVYVPDEFVRNNQVLNQYDIIITMSSGSKDHIGKNGFYYFEKKVGFGAFCAKLAAKENFRYYLYSFTQSDFMFETIKNESLGTNINNLNNSLVNGFKLVMPPTKVLKAFNRLSEPFYKKIASNLQENQKLAELRDWLLPMLMNGQISVGEAEERLSMVAEARRSEERRVGKEC